MSEAINFLEKNGVEFSTDGMCSAPGDSPSYVHFDDAKRACELARKEGYKQAQDDYDIVTEDDPAFKKLNKIFDKNRSENSG